MFREISMKMSSLVVVDASTKSFLIDFRYINRQLYRKLLT